VEHALACGSDVAGIFLRKLKHAPRALQN